MYMYIILKKKVKGKHYIFIYKENYCLLSSYFVPYFIYVTSFDILKNPMTSLSTFHR